MNVVSRPTKDERQQFRRQKELKRLEKRIPKAKEILEMVPSLYDAYIGVNLCC